MNLFGPLNTEPNTDGPIPPEAHTASAVPATSVQGHDIGSAMDEIWDAHREEALVRVALLEDAAAALAAGTLGTNLREDALRAAHKLRGSAGMFGFTHASEIAAELEDQFAAEPVPTDKVPAVASKTLTLRSELEGTPAAAAYETAGVDRGVGGLLVVSDDAELVARLLEESRTQEIAATSALPAEAIERMQSDLPEVVLVDLASVGDGRELDRFTGAGSGPRSPSLLVLAASDGLLDRVELVHRGARSVLDRSLDPSALLDAVRRTEGIVRQRTATILAVDDDPSVLAALTALLAPRGYRVATTEHPARFWEQLEHVSPDLAIIDLDMPQVSGVDLCKAVRADHRWADLPLLILTAYREPELVRGAFAAGADDYLSKPILEEELVSRLTNRLERVRAQREASMREELTGLPTRRAAATELERVAANALRDQTPFSIAVIDVGGLRELNASQGLVAGDSVLKGVGETLGREFADGVLGRWSGTKFIVGLHGAPLADVTSRLDALVERLNRRGASNPVRVGLIETQPPVRLADAIATAESALSEAKRAKSGHLVTVGSESGPGSALVDVAVVEDDESVGQVLDLALETLGVSSRRIADGAEAAAELTGSPPRLVARVVLLDWDLPGLDGLSVLRRMAAVGLLATTRVVMLTARASEEETLKALELGAADFVAKPFSVPVLVERLRAVLAR